MILVIVLNQDYNYKVFWCRNRKEARIFCRGLSDDTVYFISKSRNTKQPTSEVEWEKYSPFSVTDRFSAHVERSRNKMLRRFEVDIYNRPNKMRGYKNLVKG